MPTNSSHSSAEAMFRVCVGAMNDGVLIEREGSSDKEFHFQNWFRKRLEGMDIHFEQGGRNSYPDFRLVHSAEGFELKGLAYPGRAADYDCNSQVPMGRHNGRTIFYVFGRYPTKPDGNRYPVLDLVICHGGFLNADNAYEHENGSFRGFGAYGDILVRDRKMYVAPTPFALAEGTAHRRTLILPADDRVGADLVEVGVLERREAARVVVAYGFDLRTNKLKTELVDNPTANRVHTFKAYRLAGDPAEKVKLQELSKIKFEESLIDDGLDDD